MKKLIHLLSSATILCMLTLYASCKKVEVEFDCGDVETEITELSHRVGSYTASTFNNSSSSDFEEAAIVINVENISIITETETSCFAFAPIPQLIETISITSADNITSGGVEFAPGQNVNELFIIHNQAQTYSVSAFIAAQNNEPTLFHIEEDEFVLQLLNQPDVAINQVVDIQLTFDDSKIFSIEVVGFEVSN